MAIQVRHKFTYLESIGAMDLYFLDERLNLIMERLVKSLSNDEVQIYAPATVLADCGEIEVLANEATNKSRVGIWMHVDKQKTTAIKVAHRFADSLTQFLDNEELFPKGEVRIESAKIQAGFGRGSCHISFVITHIITVDLPLHETPPNLREESLRVEGIIKRITGEPK